MIVGLINFRTYYAIMKVRPYSDVLREQPSASTGWKPILGSVDGKETVTGFSSDKHGEIKMVFVCDDDGKARWDQPQMQFGPVVNGKRAESAGAIIVPYYTKIGEMYVGLLEEERPVPRYRPNGDHSNLLYHALPRGFVKPGEAMDAAAVRELGEEAGKAAISVYNLGGFNEDTAFYAGYNSCYAIKVDELIEAHLRPDANEKILRCKFYRYPKEVNELVAQRKLDCGETLATLRLFDANIPYLP